MSADSEIAEAFRHWKKDKQARHARWKEENTKYLIDHNVSYVSKNDGNTLLIRTEKIRADFYPSTGRWMECGHPHKMMRGGAQAFYGWLQNKGVI